NLEISARKKTEIALEESERNFHDIFETIEDIILVASKEGEIFYSNVSAQKKLGYSSEELKNMHVLDLNPAEKRAEAEQIFGDMFSGKRTICPLPLVKKDGKEIPSETRIWFGKWNGRECIFAIVKDLSTEQFALDKFQKIFQGNPALMSLSNVSDGKFTEVNNAFLKSVGYSKEEIIGKTSEELDLFVDKNLRVRVGELLSNRGTMSNVEMDIRKKNGEIINGLFFGEIIENEKERAFLNVMLDATESRNAVAQLRESERILKEKNILQRMVTDISRDLISANMKNIDGKINDILKTVGEFLGIDRCYIFRMLEGKKMVLTNEWHQKGLAPIWFVNPEISFEDFEAWAEKLKRENNIYIPDIRNIKENEQQQITIFGNLKIKSLLNIKIMNNDKLDGFFGFASTITYKEFRYDQIELLNIMANSLSDAFSRIKMEAELLLAKQKAEMDNALKTDFFVNMSHELRTPINVMRSSIQLLELKICKAEDEESKKILKQLKLMNRNSMRITRLVNNIIDVAKIDSGFYEPAFENVDIVKIIKKIFLSINQYAKQKMIKLTFVADQEGEIIKCDVAMIERIMLNVISNAIKYSKKGGYIKISVYKKPATISISVKDNGIGIEKEMQEIIFERYRQANPKLLQKSEGSGIGLSLAKSLVEIHGGTIQVISQYGEGSEFIIELPKELLENEKSPPIHYDENDELKVFMANVDIEMADLDFN
ncbi:MAG: PAS domain S-box protein, partial [Eubacteriales bacterium]